MAGNTLVDDHLAGLAFDIDPPLYPSKLAYTLSTWKGTFLCEPCESVPVHIAEHGIVLRTINFDLMERGHSLAMPFPGMKKQDADIAASRRIQWGTKELEDVTQQDWYWNWCEMWQRYYAVLVDTNGKATFRLGLQYPSVIDNEPIHPYTRNKPSSELFVRLLENYTTDSRSFKRAESVKTYINLLLEKFQEFADADYPTAVRLYFHDVRSLEKYLEIPRPGPTSPPPSREIWYKYAKLRTPGMVWTEDFQLGFSLGLLYVRFKDVLDRPGSSDAASFRWFFWLHRCLEDYHKPDMKDEEKVNPMDQPTQHHHRTCSEDSDNMHRAHSAQEDEDIALNENDGKSNKQEPSDIIRKNIGNERHESKDSIKTFFSWEEELQKKYPTMCELERLFMD